MSSSRSSGCGGSRTRPDWIPSSAQLLAFIVTEVVRHHEQIARDALKADTRVGSRLSEARHKVHKDQRRLVAHVGGARGRRQGVEIVEIEVAASA